MSEPSPIYEIDEKALTSLIRTRADGLFGDRLPAISNVSVTLPSAEQFQTAWQSGGLLAMDRVLILVEPEGGLPSLKLRAPMPFHGVFVLQGRVKEALGESKRNTLWTWCPWLAEAGGARLVRGNSDQARLSLRIGSGGGAYVDVPMMDEQGKILGPSSWWGWAESNFRRNPRRNHERRMLIQTPERLPPELQEIIANTRTLPVLRFPDTDPSRALWAGLWEYAQKQLDAVAATDLDDLGHRMLMTYPFWLASRIVQRIWELAFADMPASSNTLASKRWENSVVGGQRAIEASLFPKKSLLKIGRLHAFCPANPIDAISQLTQVKRYDISPGVIDHLPAAFHQNHPSFFGRICPVETPESESLGISLHLAKGAWLDADGMLRPCAEGAHGLGWAASLVPLFEHNDAVRNMMGAKNLKQGVPVATRHPPAVATMEEDEILLALGPLLAQGVIPDASDGHGRLAMGVDLLVAYMPYFGLNFEDAIVANQRLVDEGVLDLTREEDLSFRLDAGYASLAEHRNVLRSADAHVDNDGLARPRTKLCRGMVLASLWHPRSESEHHIRYQDMEPAELLSIKIDYDGLFGGRLTCRVRRHYPLGPGDKLMGRHGNKGVVSAFRPPEQMPRLPDDLPKDLRGRAVDLVLNPHGVISRMNLGQLMETHLGWLHHALPPDERSMLQLDCSAFAQQYPLHADRIAAALGKTGLDATGKLQLKLPDGTLTEQPVVVGFQHIVRLRHIPTLKSQSRGRREESIYDMRTGQAVHGRRAGGGQRVGEMELWALAGHQADHIISEVLYAKSDIKTFHHPDPVAGDSSTWQALQDHLFSVGISAELHDGKVQFSWARLKVDDWSSGTITGRVDLIRSRRSAFQCQRCNYCPSETALVHGMSAEYVELNEVLRAMGWHCPDKPAEWIAGGVSKKGIASFSGKWKLRSLRSSRTAMAAVECTEKKTDVSIRMQFCPGRGKADTVLTASGRKPGLGGTEARETKQGFTAEGLARLSPDGNLRPLGELQVTCSAAHPSLLVKPLEGRSTRCLCPAADGLFSPSVFGSDQTKDRRWGSIELPMEVPFPSSEFLRTQKYRCRGETFIPPSSIRYVPVLPPKYRAFHPDAQVQSELPRINIEYRRLLDLCRDVSRRLLKAPSPEQNAALMAEIQAAVGRVFECCLGALGGKVPKEGLLRRHGLGRRVDCSGRLVIVPDPGLSPAECRVPAHILWELLSDDIVQWLKEAETFFAARDSGRIKFAEAFAEAEKVSLQALSCSTDLYARRFDILQKKLLDFHTAAELRARTVTEGAVEGLCLRTLEGFLAEHPDKLLILNRQPSLHKYSMLAFRPVPSRMSEGEVLRLSPLVCGAFGADFDGDEMALHWPLSDAAHKEAGQLLFRNNLISEANDRPLAHYAQDVVLGIYLLRKRGQESRLYDLLPDRERPEKCCCAAIAKCKEWTEAAGIDLLQHICVQHADQAGIEGILHRLFECAFMSATEAGTSFGYFDLCPPPRADIESAVRPLESLDAQQATVQTDVVSVLVAADQTLADVSKAHLEKVAQSSSARPGYGIAVMAVSGARKAGQMSQLLAMRGLLAPGATGFHTDPLAFFFRHSLAAGCDRTTYYRTVYNSRSSMCDKKLGTGKAGWLTRELVGAMWDVVVVAGDCGAEGERSPATCKLTRGVCQHCYGPAVSSVAQYVEPATRFYRAGYPAGLIAAQSIGERGTQLSMQSFHTAKQAFTPDSVRKLMNTPELFDFAALALVASQWGGDEKLTFHELAESVYGLIPDLRTLHEQRQGTSRGDKATITKAIKALTAHVLGNPALAAQVDSALLSGFVSMLRSNKAYATLLTRHLDLLWRAIHGSRGKKLTRLTSQLPPLAALGFRPIRRTLYGLAAEAESDPLIHPASMTMVGIYRMEK